MKGDFSRDTFDPAKHFSRVLMQQGRVTLDADYNEQTEILLHYLRTLARDLIGPYAVPVEHGGFALTSDEKGGFKITAGRIYVDGILVENDDEYLYSEQPNYHPPEDDPLIKELKGKTGQAFWIYLDIWERHITSIEDDSIREKALGGQGTCTRTKIVWQVRALPVGDHGTTPQLSCDEPLSGLVALRDARLAARVDPGLKKEDPCVTPPASKYRGAENQLYRVEIHRGGKAGEATFKWSRNNGSVATAWLGTSGHDLQVANTRGFEAGSWVELSDDALDLDNQPGVLVKLAKVEGGVLSVDPDTVPTPDALAWGELLIHPKVRRWDQFQTDDIVLNDGALPIAETSDETPVWIDLEDGVQVQFAPGGTYRSGDYWPIPARIATSEIEWPLVEDASGNDTPELLPPRGIEHHYAPLGFVGWRDEEWKLKSCRCDFEPLSSCFGMGSIAVGAHLIRQQPRSGATIAPGRSTAVAKPAGSRAEKPARAAMRRKKR
jgi:hypothetical protein